MTSAEPTFTRLAGSELFWLDSSTNTIGFQATPGSGLPDTPTLAQTWAVDAGLYFLLGSAPKDEAAFSAALEPYLREQGWPNGPRLLWLRSPDGPADRWLGQLLALTPSGTVRRRVDFVFGSFALTISAGSAMTLAVEPQEWGFAFTGSAPEATLTAPGGEYPIAAAPLRLPLAGATSGCWRMPIALDAGAEPQTDFQRLALGIRYFCPDPARSVDATGEGGVYVRALKLPTLLQPAAPMKLDVAIDPLRPLTSDRTHLSFIGAGPAIGALESTFATARGHAVSLTPLAAAGGLPDARLAFAVQPLFVGPQPVPIDYYLTLQGAFAIGWGSTSEAPLQRLLCGSSGLEYLGVSSTAAGRLLFTPGGAAYTPLAASSDPSEQPLQALGTTAWVSAATDGAGARYYAQPEEAPLYKAPAATNSDTQGDDGNPIGSVFLDFLETPALALSADGSGPRFPLTPLRGLSVDDVELARRIEAEAIAPARRRALLPGTSDTPDGARLASGADTGQAPGGDAHNAQAASVGVTPQGLGVGVAADGESWTWLGIANDSSATQGEPDLRFTEISGEFRAAIQTNRLFLVLANADAFAPDGSVAYRLTAEGLAELAAANTVPATVLQAVKTAFQAAGYPLYATESEYEAALIAASAQAAQYKLQFEQVAGLLSTEIDGWRFQLSPRNWTAPGRQTLLIFKLARGRTLRELAADLTSWSWLAAGAIPGGSAADAQAQLERTFAETDASYRRTSTEGRQSPYADIVALLDNPSWTGMIAFDCQVPLSSLPEPLQALAAGIDARRFRAHHVGFDVTPFGAEPGRLVFGRSSAFGLIDYRDETDQHASSEVSYAFKVLGLTVGFRNSAISSFSSRVQLLVNRLLGATARLYPTLHGNNVMLDGVYQHHPTPDGRDHGTYVFSSSEQNRIQIEDSALREVRLSSAQLVTTRPALPGDPSSPVLASFVFGGDLRFYEPTGFDAFSFGAPEDETAPPPQPQGEPVAQPADGGLRFGGLEIAMEFLLADPKPTFAQVTEELSFDLANSRARPNSLFARFPLSLRGLLGGQPPQPASNGAQAQPTSSRPPDALGYVSIGAPVQQARMTDPWYGLAYDIDLGTLGALAGSAGLTLSLLVAWSAGGTREQPAIYLGVQLPGVQDVLGVEMPLQGVLSLGFRTIELAVADGTSGREYLLRFRNFALRVLGIALPPGHNDITLFANPNQAASTKLGWYAAYSAEKDPKQQRQLARRRSTV